MEELIHTVENFYPQKAAKSAPAAAGRILLPEPVDQYSLN